LRLIGYHFALIVEIVHFHFIPGSSSNSFREAIHHSFAFHEKQEVSDSFEWLENSILIGKWA